jgi:hypothetical protein
MTEIIFDNVVMEAMFEERTLVDNVTRSLSMLSLAPLRDRAMISRVFVGPHVFLPSGVVVDVPHSAQVLTIAMDGGFDVHVERQGDAALVTVEAPPGISFGSPTEDLVRAQRRFARLLAPYQENPHHPVRWLTLSFQNVVRVPGIGRITVKAKPATFVVGERRIGVRRLGVGDVSGPEGAVEVLIDPGTREW